MLVGIDIEKQVLDFGDNFLHPSVGPVDLVDDQHDWQIALQRLAQHEAGLGERAFAGIDQKQDAIDHGEGAFDLAAKVGVARGVDHIDLETVPPDSGVLGQDRDALFLLEVHGVHDALVHVLMGPKGT